MQRSVARVCHQQLILVVIAYTLGLSLELTWMTLNGVKLSVRT